VGTVQDRGDLGRSVGAAWRRVLRALVVKLFLLAFVAGYFGGQALGSAVLLTPPGAGGDAAAGRAAVRGSVGWLVDRHGCWTGDAPARARIPGHVVVTVDGEPGYGGRRLVEQALAEVFEDADHGLTVHAFCE
jgi:hypothetical protein